MGKGTILSGTQLPVHDQRLFERMLLTEYEEDYLIENSQNIGQVVERRYLASKKISAIVRKTCRILKVLGILMVLLIAVWACWRVYCELVPTTRALGSSFAANATPAIGQSSDEELTGVTGQAIPQVPDIELKYVKGSIPAHRYYVQYAYAAAVICVLDIALYFRLRRLNSENTYQERQEAVLRSIIKDIRHLGI